MKLKPLLTTIAFIVLLTNGFVRAQNKVAPLQLETMLSYWHSAMDDIKKQSGATDENFKQFLTFYNQQLAKEEGDFFASVQKGEVTLQNVQDYLKGKQQAHAALYKRFEVIKRDNPSLITKANMANNPPKISSTCNPSATNIDFEQGTLNGWDVFYGYNNTSSSSFFNVIDITGGPAGAATKAGGPDPYTGNDYQVHITSGPGNDPIIPSIPVVSPYGGKYSVMVGDSSNINYGVALLSQQFTVSSANDLFTYQYALFLQDPNHPYYDQPFFNVIFLDPLGDTIPNLSYELVEGYHDAALGFDSVTYGGVILHYHNWQSTTVSLKKYIGQCVTVHFVVADCGLGGHFGYAYLDAQCAPLTIMASSPSFCGQSIITLSSPSGATSWHWTGPTGGIVSADTLQNIKTDSAGTYTLIATFYGGVQDTLTITIPKSAGPPPIPSFTTNTVCSGQSTLFTNTSNPLSGGSFYWDFNKVGYYQDSSLNPSWTYNSPGVYSVKLHEVYNGCGADTIINITVDTTPTAVFSSGSACMNQPINFTTSSSGVKTYKWNFGDPGSGTADTSSAQNPSHTYSNNGTYTVTLVASNGGPCPDTITHTVMVSPIPKPVVTGVDSICKGQSTTLTASFVGATSYSWAPFASVSCSVCQSTTATPTVTTTYTLTVSNGFCTGDTTFTVVVKSPPVASIIAKPDTICKGDSILMIGQGGCSYIWTNNGTTTDSIWIKPTISQIWYLQATCNGCSSGTNKGVTVNSACCNNNFNEQICVVTTDTSINKYEVIWERLNSPPSGYYNVYRENSSSVFVKIDSQLVSNFTTYTDNASNPNVKAETYELGTYDSCGNSSMSSPHTGCMLSVSNGTGKIMYLNWTPYIGFTVSQYYIYRGPSHHLFSLLDSVSGSTLNYTDSNSPSGSHYLIKAMSTSGPCVPSMIRNSNRTNLVDNHLYSLSNTVDSIPLSVNNVTGFSRNITIYPVPAQNNVVLQFGSAVHNERYQVINTLGQVVDEGVISGTRYTLNISSFTSGMYLVHLTDSQGMHSTEVKFIKQ